MCWLFLFIASLAYFSVASSEVDGLSCPRFVDVNSVISIERSAVWNWPFRYPDGKLDRWSCNYRMRELFQEVRTLIDQTLAPYCLQNGISLEGAIDTYRVMFSAALWIAERSLYLVVARVFSPMRNSFVYASFFDSNWNAVGSDAKQEKYGAISLPSILPIPMGNSSVPYAGPEDSRVFRFRDSVLCIFNQIDAKDGKRKIWIFDFKSGGTFPLKHERYIVEKDGKSWWRFPKAEKNWIPLVVGDRLYVVYNFLSLQVIDCSDFREGAACKWVRGDFDPVPGALRGGTPFIPIFENFFFSIGYTHLRHPRADCDVYRPALILLKMEDPGNPASLQLVHVSAPLALGQGVFLLEPTAPERDPDSIDVCGLGRIVTVPSVNKLDSEDDRYVVTVNVNDAINAALHVNGIEAYLSHVINAFRSGLAVVDERCAEYYATKYYEMNRV